MYSKTVLCFLLAASVVGMLNAHPAQDEVDQDEFAPDDQDDELVSQNEIQDTLDEPFPTMDESDVQEDVRVSIKDRRAEMMSVMRVVRSLGPQYSVCLTAQRGPLRKVWSEAKAAAIQCRAGNQDKATCEQAVVAASAEGLGKALLEVVQCIKDTASQSSGVTRGWFRKIRGAIGKVYNFGRKVCGSGYVNCARVASGLLRG